MAVVEITQLRLKGSTANDSALLKSLSQVRSKLQTNSRFFSCMEETSLIYIFGVWPSLDAHLQFLASPARDEVLGPQEAILDFQWTIHLELEATNLQLLDAPFLAIERLEVDAANAGAYDQAVDGYAPQLRSNRRAPENVAYAWRCDMPTGGHEAVILTVSSSKGCGSPEEGRHFTLKDDENGTFRRILSHHAWNMEHAQF